MKELSLRPYNGRLFVAKTPKEYEAGNIKLFNEPDVISCRKINGRFNGGEGKDGMWTYIVWGKSQSYLAHEISHAILHMFERCGIDPRSGNGEPFCYMLSQLLLEAQ